MSKTTREEQLKIKAQEVIDLLKEYLPEYKEAFDAYNPDEKYNLDICEEDEGLFGEFSFILMDKSKKYVMHINKGGILAVVYDSNNSGKVVDVAEYIDEETCKYCSWTWDDAIEEIKRQMEERKQHDV